MLQRMNSRRRILMTVDAVGGVWQYAVGLAGQLVASGDIVVFAGLGPPPTPEQRRTAEAIVTLEWLRSPPDWMARHESEIAGLRDEIARLVDRHAIDLVQVNEPGQAAELAPARPVVAVSHSCIGTWFRAVHKTPAPDEWTWHEKRTGAGMRRADLVIAPSESHAAALAACYGDLPPLTVVHNAVPAAANPQHRDDIVFAAGRWWDDGKNGKVLDRAAAHTQWPVFAAGATTGPSGGAMAFQNVVSLGSISNMETRSLAARCGLFVSPSLYEPFGLAALEAAAAGTPLVLADIPTYRELWSDAAVFFSPNDAVQLTKAINRLASDGRLRDRLGSAAAQRSRSFAPARQTAAMRAAYDRAMAIRAEAR